MIHFLRKSYKREKRKFILVFLLIFVVFISLLLFRRELYLFVITTIEFVCYRRIFVVSFLMDLIIQPFGSGSLVFISAALGKNVFIAPLMAGLGSVAGGFGGYLIGKKIGAERFERVCGKKNFKKTEKLFDKYGVWAVLAAGLLPVPYNAVCWAAGIYGMKKRVFIASALATRIPRFLFLSLIGFIF